MNGSLRDDLQSALGTAYTLERELGGGGMSRVFLAEEARLGRKVVVKVLTPELAAGLSADRFEREIRLAAQLAHPSIVPVLAAGDANGLPYYTMPFVQGESLRVRIAVEGRLPLKEVANILRDIARALSYAHERGIVHRDIKPENVLLASGAAVVTDFGIAKAISASRTVAGEATLTSVGTSIGTPAYMAPEQGAGDPATDARADIYAFGCVAYELLGGEAPFHGRPIHKLLAAHISEKPVDIAALRPECPPPLATFVMRCLEKDPELRPQSAAEVLPALETVTTPPGDSGGKIDTTQASAKPSLPRKFLIPLGFALAAAAIVVTWMKRTPDPETAPSALHSIAVLPFANVDGDTANTYFADGIAEELATALSKVNGLRVVARSSSFLSSGRPVDEHEVARKLNVDALLLGSVRRAAGRMRITARLIGVKDESLLWSDQYDREIKDVFALQDEITRAIVAAIQPQLSSKSVQPVDSAAVSRKNAGTSNVEAHDLYLRAQFYLRRRTIPLAVTYFERAIAIDGTYARAFSGLSAALELTPYFAGTPAEEVRARATAAARRALELDPSLAEAHTSLAMAHMHAHQWAESEREHRLALAADPTDAAARVQFARLLFATGRLKEAYEEARRAEALDPFSAVIESWVAYTAMVLGKTDEAVASATRALELDSTTAPAINAAGQVYLAAGDKAKAIATIDHLPNVLPWPGLIAYVHAVAGDRATALRIVREIESRRGDWSAGTALGFAYLGLRDTTRAMDALERATEDHEMWYVWFSVAYRFYDPVRGSARFAAVLRRVGLDDKLFTTVDDPSRR